MSLSCRSVQLRDPINGLAVRPGLGGGPACTLAFLRDGGMCELDCAGPDSSGLGPQLPTQGKALGSAFRPVYDPCTDAVLVVPRPWTAVLRLNANREVSLLAGSVATSTGIADGVGAVARFSRIVSTTTDARGSVFCVDWGGKLRRLDTRSGHVATLAAVEPPKGTWWSVAYDSTTGALYAATKTAVCRLRPSALTASGSGSGSRAGGEAEEAVELVAGDWAEEGDANGPGAIARFHNITALLALPGSGRLLIADGPDLRCLLGYGVNTLASDCLHQNGAQQLVLLPHGELAAVSCWSQDLALFAGPELASGPAAAAAGPSGALAAAGRGPGPGSGAGFEFGGFRCVPDTPVQSDRCFSMPRLGATSWVGPTVGSHAPATPAPTAAAAAASTAPVVAAAAEAAEVQPVDPSRLLGLLAAPSAAGGGGFVTVLLAGGQATVAHRSVLAAGSGFFATHLAAAPADAAALEMSLTDADPDAFAVLLRHMYGIAMDMYPSPYDAAVHLVAAVPAELLRPTAVLASRLDVHGAVAALAERLAAAATPATAVQDLVWADAHHMSELATRLRRFVLSQRSLVVREAKADVLALVGRRPELAAELMMALMEAENGDDSAGLLRATMST
ncbi:hypothetical protein HYH03_016182 [Edaphochlamys debaryana]|uniref:BTB domain-containing protein n=1 Tax=Edaphochlamys debaryana TaxID=47281 RepID=A0A835XKJ0_9CHLO|nr:hypothetical protein HYH03_016182 [Edaphochlamys debaryana]|eukprot:KAG2485085.1 hypothetical protein HYH03_016182 [Edaphochlamys debaryana]